MTDEQLPTPPPPAPKPDPEPEPEAKRTKASSTGSGRFAVYNATLTQYVGSVMDERPKQADANKMVPKGHKAEIREV